MRKCLKKKLDTAFPSWGNMTDNTKGYTVNLAKYLYENQTGNDFSQSPLYKEYLQYKEYNDVFNNKD